MVNLLILLDFFEVLTKSLI